MCLVVELLHGPCVYGGGGEEDWKRRRGDQLKEEKKEKEEKEAFLKKSSLLNNLRDLDKMMLAEETLKISTESHMPRVLIWIIASIQEEL